MHDNAGNSQTIQQFIFIKFTNFLHQKWCDNRRFT